MNNDPSFPRRQSSLGGCGYLKSDLQGFGWCISQGSISCAVKSPSVNLEENEKKHMRTLQIGL